MIFLSKSSKTAKNDSMTDAKKSSNMTAEAPRVVAVIGPDHSMRFVLESDRDSLLAGENVPHSVVSERPTLTPGPELEYVYIPPTNGRKGWGFLMLRSQADQIRKEIRDGTSNLTPNK